ncbi:HAD-IIB family hydrolase [Gayadomonas joobiniege]|uniref:HAD-IIB family hydrolase n=1 Tax=Gayadomonas joobiniege TaxID=1234606 RepID=UPI00037F1F3E|nr:HAD-IIB family hydrolase [Gayadomonas joobiniege]
MTKHLLVFTDMDGTLLDHDDYSWDAAKPALAELQKAEVPVICNTSKTFHEVAGLHRQMNIKAPFIVENGSAIYPAEAHKSEETLHINGAKRADILRHLAKMREKGFEFSGFNDWTQAQIIEHTGLNEADAAKSGQRDFSEPLLFNGNTEQKEEFIRLTESAGYLALQGGRFLSVQGQCDKGVALKWLAQKYAQQWQAEVLTIALGDSENDVAMLEAADVAVWIKRDKAAPQLSRTEQVFFATEKGPVGWNQIMAHLLQLHQSGKLKTLR